MKALPSLFLHAGLARLCLAQSHRQCYYPNGDVQLNDHPCDPDAEHSVCCGAPPYGAACLSNKLCLGLDGYFSRGTCTDQSWDSPECARFCLEPLDAGSRLTSCSNITGTDSWCCDYYAKEGGNCCDVELTRLEFGQSEPYTWAQWVGAGSGSYSVVTPLSTQTRSRSTSTTSGASTTTTSTSSTETIASLGGTTADATTSARTTAPAGAGSGEPSEDPGRGQLSASSEPSGLSTGAQAGIGVGAAIGALLVAVVAYMFWKLHRQNKALEAALYEQQGQWAAAASPGQYYAAAPGPKLEMPADLPHHELDGSRPPMYELSGMAPR